MRILAAVSNKCIGCGICVLRCSIEHYKTHIPSKSCIYVSSGPDFDEPTICTQCGLCMLACPLEGAIKKDRRTGAIVITEKCNGCGQCIIACPYGVIKVNRKDRKAIKCDLCKGDPECAKWCPSGALIYAPPEKAAYQRRKKSVGK